MNKRLIGSVLAVMMTVTAFLPSGSVAAEGGADQAEGGTPEERLYCVGSVSKVYVTAAVMQLADKGLVDIDAPLTTYIPEFRMADPRYVQISVRMLMNHTSGIMGTRFTNMELYGDSDMGGYDDLLASLADQRLKADPGEYAAYCNDGFCLLAMVVERVSGMSYTDYVVRNIAGRIGCEDTGTPVNMYGYEDKAQIFSGRLPHDYEYCMALGSGGIYAAASDVAEFGSSFWTGDNRLLSESAKDDMATRWNASSDNSYQDGSGLGWDYVEQIAYEREGVRVQGKGGDITNMHAHLLVAPDNDISVSVLSSGGSSTLNRLVAEALLDVALEEQGITVDHSADDIELAGDIPEEFNRYAGSYALYSLYGTSIAEISFPDSSYMQVDIEGLTRTETHKYMYTATGGFAEVNDYGMVKNNAMVVYFEDGEDGRTYIKGSMDMEYPELGTTTMRMYVGENMEDNPVSDDVMAAFENYSSCPWVLTGDTYSSASYDSPFMFFKTVDDHPGYVIVYVMGQSRVLKIDDAFNVSSFTTLPSSSNRDLVDGCVTPGGAFLCSNGMKFEPLAMMPELTDDVTEIELTDGCASWYRIGDETAGTMINVNRPDSSMICVYNKYYEPVYSTHVTDASDQIDLPEDGYIVFAGQTGGSVLIE
ncbi:MAG: beta-lactamase family protein [Clostridiales bacterium]|nr:beta-lactamase family protein [Clostridiales bacterium]